jgi:hypothetical protein
MTVGYSGTPLGKKLGIKAGTRILPLDAPKDYPEWLGPLPSSAVYHTRVAPAGSDIVHLFVNSLAELEARLPEARKAMTQDGALWVSWHKKSSKIPTDVTENAIRTRALKGDLVDVKVCAVSEEWSGLKLVVRKHLRQGGVGAG